MDNPPQPLKRESIGRYRILNILGQGGMGTVYLAYDPKLARKVALKVPKFREDDNQESLDRFLREARSVASLRHPNLCPIYDVGEEADLCYFTMSYIEGPSLSSFTRPTKLLPPRRIAHVIRKVALGVDAAHRKGVIHRDLKPSNIMIDREHNEPVVMDFGLARSTKGDASRITHLGLILGTPSYMSPEQVLGDWDQIGPSTDIYSLGVVLYQLLTGRLPFEGPVARVLALIQTQDPQPPSSFRADLDPQLEALCLKAMAKQAIDRFESMQHFAGELADFLRQSRSRTSPDEFDRSENDIAIPEAESETPTVTGGEQVETVSDRILKHDSAALSQLGFDEEIRAEIQSLVAQGSGVLLACGPAGSGTTTTINSILSSIDTYFYTVYSIAKSEQYHLNQIEKYQSGPDAILADALRRCTHLFEPDVLLLDPMRDAESAQAVFSCDSEVVLLSEFEAFDAASGILQLINWTGSPQLVADRLLGIFSQRVVRLLCPDCKEAFRPNPAILSSLGLTSQTKQLFRTPAAAQDSPGSGPPCQICGGSGYSGRTGLVELILNSQSMKGLIATGPSVSALRTQARNEKMPRIQRVARRLVLEGQTSVDELKRIFSNI